VLREFIKFIQRGNVLDLAVAVVVGGAFGRITTSLVNDIIMPPIGLLIGGVDFGALGIILAPAGTYASVPEAIAAGAPVIAIGAFLNTLVNFLIIALTIFLALRIVTRIGSRSQRNRTEVAPAAPPAPAADVQLLTEIRDLLKAQGTPNR
jgi:large conductance mechanosensitive channel